MTKVVKPKPKPIKKVDARLFEYAFELYYCLGPDRHKSGVCGNIAKQMGQTLSQIVAWKKKYSWDKKVEIRDMQIRERLDREMTEEYAGIKLKYKKMVINLLDRALEDVVSGNIKIESVRDFETIIKLSMLVDGHATERIENVVIKDQTEEEYSRLSTDELRKIVECEEGSGFTDVSES